MATEEKRTRKPPKNWKAELVFHKKSLKEKEGGMTTIGIKVDKIAWNAFKIIAINNDVRPGFIFNKLLGYYLKNQDKINKEMLS